MNGPARQIIEQPGVSARVAVPSDVLVLKGVIYDAAHQKHVHTLASGFTVVTTKYGEVRVRGQVSDYVSDAAALEAFGLPVPTARRPDAEHRYLKPE